jgi:hypothetical protein
MKSSQRFLLQCGISFLLPPLLLTGCSLIGMGIGAISDSGKKGGEDIAGLEGLRTLRPNTGIVLITRSGGRIEGDYLGIGKLNRQEYDREYLASAETLKAKGQLPMPADTISFEYYEAPGRRVRGLFRGVDPGTLVLWSGGYSLPAIRDLRGEGGRPLDQFALREFTEGGRLPYVSRTVQVDRGKDTLEVPIDEIVRFEQGSGGSGMLTGFLVGAVIDAIVLIAVTHEAREANDSCSKGWGWNNGGCHSASHAY